jgi:Ca2+-binding EF-hand superfamily protein
MGMAMDPEAIRQRFEANRRKFREEQVERAWKEMSGDATSIPVADFGAVCFKVDSSMDAAAVQSAVGEIDKDGDGTIDLSEFRAWYMERLAAQDAESRKQREAGFGDESDWDEVEMQRRMQKHMQSMEAARIRRTFNTIDEDGSGEIERNEFHRLVRRLAPERSPQWINNQFDLADDGSGSLDFDEFKAWWESPEIKEMRGEDLREVITLPLLTVTALLLLLLLLLPSAHALLPAASCPLLSTRVTLDCRVPPQARAKAKMAKLQDAVAEKQAARAERRVQVRERMISCDAILHCSKCHHITKTGSGQT